MIAEWIASAFFIGAAIGYFAGKADGRAEK